MDSLEMLIELQSRQNEQRAAGMVVVKGAEVPWEQTRDGKQRWYMHPSRNNLSLNSYLFYVQELEPGGKSGKQHFQGGRLGYIWRGRGYTTVNGKRHEWSEGDLINLPILSSGITVQHFNLLEEDVSIIVFIEPNLVDALGVSRGCGFSLLDD